MLTCAGACACVCVCVCMHAHMCMCVCMCESNLHTSTRCGQPHLLVVTAAGGGEAMLVRSRSGTILWCCRSGRFRLA